MNRWGVPVCIAAGLLCVRAGAQKWDVECDAATYGAEKRDAPNRNIDAGACLAPLESRPAPGGISARTLKHKPSKAARTEFDHGVQSWLKGRSEEAAEHFTEAIRLDPDSVEARMDLGIIYAKTGRPEQALDQDEQGLALEPNLAILHTNKAAALVMLNRWREAETAARRAVQIDSRSTAAHYMLGLAMLMQDKVTPEVAEHLASASKAYSKAKVLLIEVQEELRRNGPH